MNVILRTDFEIGGHIKAKGSLLVVTNSYGKKLILNKVAREENTIDKVFKKKK